MRPHGFPWYWRRDRGDAGFSLIEMVVAIALGALAFAALAGLAASALKALSVQKMRSRANEVATQAIEDLQRYPYDRLGVCAAPPGEAPPELTDTVFLANCSSPTYQEPCTPVEGLVARAAYTCRVNNVDFQVRRYVAWGDEGRTIKRLAVFVDWDDQVGRHQISQQSSLRAPDQGSVVGVPPPVFDPAPQVRVNMGPPASNTVKLLNNRLKTKIEFVADVKNIPDSVFVAFNALDEESGEPVGRTLALTPGICDQATACRWEAALAGESQFLFGAGTQFVRFVAVRSSDGKVNSRVYNGVITFEECTDSGLSDCSAIDPAPSITGTSIKHGEIEGPTAVPLTVDGQLCEPISLAATTSNLTLSDTVSVSFETLAGPYTFALWPDETASQWSVTVPSGAGHRFPVGPDYAFYFTAAQIYDPPQTYGQTSARKSAAFKFDGMCG